MEEDLLELVQDYIKIT